MHRFIPDLNRFDGFYLPSGRFNVVVQFFHLFFVFLWWWWCCFSPEECWSKHEIRLLNNFVLNSFFHYIFFHLKINPYSRVSAEAIQVSYIFLFYFLCLLFFLMPSIFFSMSIKRIIVVIWPCLASIFFYSFKLWVLNSYPDDLKNLFLITVKFNSDRSFYLEWSSVLAGWGWWCSIWAWWC